MPTRFRTRPAQNAARIEQRQECSQKADLPRPMLGGMGRCGARKAGFTIAELLIVVAIVGVLVAIAIPVFTSQLEKAQEATCLANRRSVKGLVVADYLDSHTELTSERFAELVAEVGPNLCPNGGEYLIKLDLTILSLDAQSSKQKTHGTLTMKLRDSGIVKNV